MASITTSCPADDPTLTLGLNEDVISLSSSSLGSPIMTPADSPERSSTVSQPQITSDMLTTLLNRTEYVARREGVVSEREKWLKREGTMITEQQEDLQKTGRMIEKEVEEHDRREQGLNQREQDINNQRHRDLDQRERDLNQRERDLEIRNLPPLSRLQIALDQLQACDMMAAAKLYDEFQAKLFKYLAQSPSSKPQDIVTEMQAPNIQSTVPKTGRNSSIMTSASKPTAEGSWDDPSRIRGPYWKRSTALPKTNPANLNAIDWPPVNKGKVTQDPVRASAGKAKSSPFMPLRQPGPVFDMRNAPSSSPFTFQPTWSESFAQISESFPKVPPPPKRDWPTPTKGPDLSAPSSSINMFKVSESGSRVKKDKQASIPVRHVTNTFKVPEVEDDIESDSEQDTLAALLRRHPANTSATGAIEEFFKHESERSKPISRRGHTVNQGDVSLSVRKITSSPHQSLNFLSPQEQFKQSKTGSLTAQQKAEMLEKWNEKCLREPEEFVGRNE